MKFLIKILLIVLINAVVFWTLDIHIFAHQLTISGGIEGYAFVAGVFTLLNLILRPIINLLTLPFRLITLGAFSIAVNGIMLFVLEQSVNFLEMFNTELSISGISTYILAGAILSVVNTVLHWLRG